MLAFYFEISHVLYLNNQMTYKCLRFDSIDSDAMTALHSQLL